MLSLPSRRVSRPSLCLRGLGAVAALLASVLPAAPSGADASDPATSDTVPRLAFDASRGGGPFGPAIAVDPAFEYYSRQPWSETFRLIRAAGFTAAQIIDIGNPATSPERMEEIVAACRAAGVSPVLRLYPPTDFALYRAHPEWRQRMLGGADGRYDWRVYLCYNQPDFVRAWCAALEEKVRRHGFDGVQLAELWLEQWGGPRDGNKAREGYACVCDRCVELFASSTGVNARDMLTSPSSAVWFKRPENTELYRRWVGFRVESVTRFGRETAAAVRRASPRAALDLMILSDARVEPDKAREYQAIDLERLLPDLRPEIVTVQDAWQDWLRPDLQPDFVASYAAAYRDRIRGLVPDVFICSHADIGSQPVSRRSRDWIRAFADETVKAGFQAPSFYEWSISRLARE